MGDEWAHDFIHIVTERVQPLGAAVAAWSSKAATAREEWLIWGLQRIAVRLAVCFPVIGV